MESMASNPRVKNRAMNDRRIAQRRADLPDSMRPFLGYLVDDERRSNDRRQGAERRFKLLRLVTR